jgi:hypothetical protein
VPEIDGFVFVIVILLVEAPGFDVIIDPLTSSDPDTLTFPDESIVIVENPIVPWLSATVGTVLISG